MHSIPLRKTKFLQSASVMTGSSATLVCLLLLHASLSSASASLTEKNDNDLENELSFPLAYQRHLRSPRLSNLLSAKNSMTQLMSNQPVQKTEGDFVSTDEVQKRVFCNSFSGCGERIGRRAPRRRRVPRRQKKSLVEKRPFCNTYGCYNGRKRSAEPLGDLPFVEPTVHRRSIEDGNANFLKQLFCTYYGVCRDDDDRRDSTLPLLIRKTYGPKETLAMLEHASEPRKSKRFFAGGFDNAMEAFVDDLKREERKEKDPE